MKIGRIRSMDRGGQVANQNFFLENWLTSGRNGISIYLDTYMDQGANKLAQRLKVLSVGTRVRIVQLLKSRALCVNALADRLNVTQSAVSQHLRVLRQAGLVIDEKRGYYVHYRLNEETFAEWREAIDQILDTKIDNCPGKKGNQKCAVATKAKKDARSRKT